MELISPLENETYDEYINRILSICPNEKIDISQDLHHIVPKSKGGSNDSSNLIWLFRSEHTKAHALYSNEHPGDAGMACAATALASKDGQLLTDEELNELAKRNSQLQSERVSGEKNPMFGKKQSEESRLKNSEHNKGKSAGEKNYFFNKHFCGELHPRYGTHASEEQKRKQSEAMKGKPAPNRKRVRCIENSLEFDSLEEAAEWCGLRGSSSIRVALKMGSQYSAGKMPRTKIKLHWELIE